ncbi:hypothetical protein ZHAS_00021660 [Anopheles sinensis]|uniref:Uncharacterized protein n=1 Tax=Anopheles sinensis TaxID=74873 RepID=A0A084WT07_ANOSI|nr:hypothetical protein ZHAS_00021660 [Anopheles sinensis]
MMMIRAIGPIGWGESVWWRTPWWENGQKGEEKMHQTECGGGLLLSFPWKSADRFSRNDLDALARTAHRGEGKKEEEDRELQDERRRTERDRANAATLWQHFTAQYVVRGVPGECSIRGKETKKKIRANQSSGSSGKTFRNCLFE